MGLGSVSQRLFHFHDTIIDIHKRSLKTANIQLLCFNVSDKLSQPQRWHLCLSYTP